MSTTNRNTPVRRVPTLGRSRQHGFVLVLALVLLTVMTLIGVSSMNSANMEIKTSSNAQQHQLAFMAVQSVLDYVISDDAVSGGLVTYQTDSAVPQTVTHTLPNTSNLSATVSYVGCSKGVGGSLEAGKGFGYNHYVVTASGQNVTGTATSTQGQGVKYPSAAC